MSVKYFAHNYAEEKIKISKSFGYETVDDMIIEFSKYTTASEIGKILGVSAYTIVRHCNALGVRCRKAKYTQEAEKTKVVNKLGYNTIDEFLIDNHQIYSAEELARVIGTTGACLRKHYQKLNLKPMSRGGNWRKHKKFQGGKNEF